MNITVRSGIILIITGAFLMGCATTQTQDGAVLGGLLGAGLGAVAGHQSGRQGEGALIGAGAGALIGALAGDSVRRAEDRAYTRYQNDQSRQTAPRQQFDAPRTSAPSSSNVQYGHYDTRIVTGTSGERYEERVWVPDR